jgi:SRSO17 transposase
MRQNQCITLSGTRTTPSQVCRWAQCLFALHTRIAPRFARSEPRRQVLAYLQGILSETSRKNGWQLAEYAGEARPDGMQRLLSHAVWDTDGVRDDLRHSVMEQLGSQEAVIVIDETSFRKRGKKSAGVGLQYCGTTGRVENCQVGVFLSYVTSRGHSLIDRELYLPADWCSDAHRRRAAAIPESVRFQTKPELAIEMMKRLFQCQLPIAWVVADTVYGGNLDLRNWLETHEYSSVLAVTCREPVGILTPDGQRRRVEASEVESLLLREHDWQRLSMSEGSKGPRLFDWAVVPILHRWQDDERHFLLIRRCIDNPQEKTYYFVFAPQGTTLQTLVKAIGARWHIEEDFENSKALGLDQYEVRSRIGWYRHITLVLLAHACLAGVCAAERFSTGTTSSGSCGGVPVLALTIPEVRRLLARLIWPAASSVRRVLAWSWWRRCHQSRASYYHTKRRKKATSSSPLCLSPT